MNSVELDEDPIAGVRAWLDTAIAARIKNADAVALATATPEGRPSVRMVLLRGIDPRGFLFYTNYESRKARELDANPRAALVLHWELLERQIRIEGAVERATREESDRYFASRPYESRLSAVASPQSREVATREELVERVRALDAQYGETQVVPRPECWGGYRIVPDRIEFWISDPHRLHDRFLYLSDGQGGWKKSRLAP